VAWKWLGELGMHVSVNLRHLCYGVCDHVENTVKKFDKHGLGMVIGFLSLELLVDS
jgi:hypothetical protein